eukprot:687434-Prymnesium_polylepis.1
MAKRLEEDNPILEARRRRAELRAEEERKAGPMDWTKINPKPKADPGREGEHRAILKMRAKNKEEASTSNTPSLPAANHWIGARAMLIWRDGCEALDEGRPDGPEGDPLFSWTETADAL